LTRRDFNANVNNKAGDSETVTPAIPDEDISVRAVCRALRADINDEKSGWVREAHSRKIVIPRSIYLADAKLWVERDGSSVSGYPAGEYGYRDFNLIEAFFIRRAIRFWIWQRGLRL
jgi:hypothetical protein